MKRLRNDVERLKEEKIEERIAQELLKLGGLEAIEYVGNGAVDIATRAFNARTDPSWGEIVGKPYFTKRLRRVIAKDKKQRRKRKKSA